MSGDVTLPSVVLFQLCILCVLAGAISALILVLIVEKDTK